MLMLPHVGLWAADCLARLRNGTGSGAGGRPGQRPPTCHDLGHLATFAAVSALRIGYPFELVLPMHRGLVSFPSVGAVRLSRRDDCRWAVVTQDRRGAAVRSARRTVRLPSRLRVRAQGADSAWRPVTWLTEEADGLRLQALVETSDSLLGQLSLGAPPRSQALLSAWRSQVRAAWRLLVRYDRPVAAGIASMVKTLIPLQQPRPGRLISATSGWAWGAIALSLAPDTATMAEARSITNFTISFSPERKTSPRWSATGTATSTTLRGEMIRAPPRRSFRAATRTSEWPGSGGGCAGYSRGAHVTRSPRCASARCRGSSGRVARPGASRDAPGRAPRSAAPWCR